MNFPRNYAGERQKPASFILPLGPCVLSASSQLTIYQSEVQQMYFSWMFLANGKIIEITQMLSKNGSSSNPTTRIHKYLQKDDEVVNIWKRQNGSSMFLTIFKIMWFEFLQCQVLFWLFPNKRVANTIIQFWCAYCHSGIWCLSSLHHAFSLSKSSRWKRSPLCEAYGTVRSQTWFIYFVQTLQLCLN